MIAPPARIQRGSVAPGPRRFFVRGKGDGPAPPREAI